MRHGDCIAHPPIDPIFDTAIVRLSNEGHGVAEIVRRLQALTPLVGKAAPSHTTTRRIVAEARVLGRLPNPYLEEIIEKLATGRMPNLYRAAERAYWLERNAARDLDHKQP